MYAARAKAAISKGGRIVMIQQCICVRNLMITSAAVVLGIDTDIPTAGYRLSRSETLLDSHRGRTSIGGPIDPYVAF